MEGLSWAQNPGRPSCPGHPRAGDRVARGLDHPSRQVTEGNVGTMLPVRRGCGWRWCSPESEVGPQAEGTHVTGHGCSEWHVCSFLPVEASMQKAARAFTEPCAFLGRPGSELFPATLDFDVEPGYGRVAVPSPGALQALWVYAPAPPLPGSSFLASQPWVCCTAPCPGWLSPLCCPRWCPHHEEAPSTGRRASCPPLWKTQPEACAALRPCAGLGFGAQPAPSPLGSTFSGFAVLGDSSL